MRRISSKTTFYYKRIFPIFWFSFLAVFFVFNIFTMSKSAEVAWPFLIIPIVMAIFGFFLMKKLIWGLVDEVWEDETGMVIKNRGEEERIPFADIKSVNCTTATNPQRITLILRTPGKFGAEINFSPLAQLGFFKNLSIHPIALELMDKADRARQS